MDRWTDVRRRAAACHAEARRAGADASASSLVSKGLELVRLERKTHGPGESGHDGVAGARLEAAVRTVYVSSELSPVDADEAVAHELGHHHLHVDPVLEDIQIPFDPAGVVARGAGDGTRATADGYSQGQVKERQANLFRDEFLCPSAWLRDRLREGTPLARVAVTVGTSLDLVRRQAVAALVRSDVQRPSPDLPGLDPEQALCVGRSGGTLVLGGPGSGKTTAMLARLRCLLRKGVPPAGFLTLVATAHAAEATRRFLAREGALFDLERGLAANERGSRGRADSEAWVGTPFDLALEIVVRWPRRAGFGEDVTSLDRTDALALLGRVMAHESGSKEEADEARRVLAALDMVRDRTAAGLRTGPEGREVERVLADYRAALVTRNAVDGGGLVPAAVAALKGDGVLRKHLRSRFGHVLVDDAHELSASEWALVTLLAPEGRSPWVTGDAEVKVGHLRGADGTALAGMAARLDVATTRLVRDHRSKGGPLAVLRRFRGERDGSGPVPAGSTSLTVAPDTVGEAAAIAARMRRLVAADVPWGEQALIGAAHSVVDGLASELRRMGIPTAHPGDVPARPDVRGLLGLVLLAKDGVGSGFADAAALPPYRVPTVVAATVKRWARENRRSLRDVLRAPRAVPGVAPSVAARLGRLGRDLDALEGAPTMPFLLDLALGEDGLARGLLRRDDGGSRASDLVALHHLLATCGEHDAEVAREKVGGGGALGGEGARLATRVGRIGSLLQDTHFRHVSASSAGLDAVAVLTAREARGREFEAVHLCGVNAPKSGDGRQALLAGLTRARTHLHVTRARVHGVHRKSRKPSPHLGWLEPILREGDPG